MTGNVVNRERVRLLVEALRSGRYARTTGTLRNEDRYCCLGVACEVAIDNGADVEWVGNDCGRIGTYDDDDESDFSDGQLPSSVQDWYGFSSADPELELDDDTKRATEEESKSAATLNDDFAWDFNRIADAFERTYLRDEEPRQA